MHNLVSHGLPHHMHVSTVPMANTLHMGLIGMLDVNQGVGIPENQHTASNWHYVTLLYFTCMYWPPW